jgi:uncharacterized RDD family membrane protein YckC
MPAQDATAPNPTVDEPIPSLKRRMAAWLYEGMLLFGVTFATDYVFSVLTNTRSGLDNRSAQQALLFLVLGIYFCWQWTRSGQTLAMKTWHLRLVRADRNTQLMTWRQAGLRYVLCWVWVLPPLLLGKVLGSSALAITGWMLLWAFVWANTARLNPKRQFLHDVWAGTQVVSHVKPRLKRS